MKDRERDVNIDIIRCAALFLVCSVHFFLWNGFYHVKMDNTEAFFLCLFRTVSMSCVPLFLMISGYLLAKRDLLPVNRQYWNKLAELLLIYLLCTFILIFFRKVLLHEPMSLYDIMKNICSFSQYSWYVFMYAGLYVLIPYLNFLWKNMGDGRKKAMLVIILCVLASVTSVINIKETVLPEVWTGIYPVTYYFLGAYISDEKTCFNKKPALALVIWICFAFLFGAFNFLVSSKDTFAMGAWNEWGSLENIVLAVLLFVFLTGLNTGSFRSGIKEKLGKVSDLVYVAFMLSYISDIVAWKLFKDIIPVSNKLLIYIPSVVISFVLALMMSWIFNLIFGMIKGHLLKHGS